MKDFVERVRELLRRNYGSTLDHAIWCGEQNHHIAWEDCSLAKQHEDAGIDISTRVMIMEIEDAEKG